MTSRDPGAGSRLVRAGGPALALHGAVLWLAAAALGERPAAHPPAQSATEIQIELAEPIRTAPATGTSPGPRAPAAAAAAAGARARGHRSREGVGRSPTHAAVAADPWADLQVSYDAPAAAASGDPAGATGSDLGAAPSEGGLGAALAGTGLGAGGDALLPGGLAPPLPPASHAAPPRPRRYYSYWKFHGTRGLWGQSARVDLTIDARGRVRDVHFLEHINPWIDQQAIDLARTFEFYPALDDAGEPIAGRYRWTFVVTN